MILSIRVDIQIAAILSYYSTTDTQSQTDTLLRLRCGSTTIANLEQHFAHLLWGNSFSRIINAYLELLARVIVDSGDLDYPSNGKLEGIFGQVYQHLLKSNLVPDQLLWELHDHFSFDFGDQAGQCLYLYLRVLHGRLWTEHARDEIKGSPRRENLHLLLELALLDQLDVQSVVHKTEKQIDLHDDKLDQFLTGLR